MKKLLKLNLKDSDEVMSKEKMGKIIGGEEPLCPPGYILEGGYCLPIDGEGYPPKIQACIGKHDGDPCSYTDAAGVEQHGTCMYLPMVGLHCAC